MTIPLLVAKSLRQHAFSSVVAASAIALAGGLIMAVWVLRTESSRAFTSVSGGFDAVLGARSSPLQLILNAIFHLEESPGNIPLAEVARVRAHPAVTLALPIAMGDNYRGYRLVGTTPALFEHLEYAPQRIYAVAAPGRAFRAGADEAVAGSFVAARLGLRVGDTFHPFHGLNFDETKAHAETYVVTGVLEPTGTPADRVIWTPLEGVVGMSGHDPRAAGEVSAVLLKFDQDNAMAGFQLDQLYNRRGKVYTLAWPIGAILAKLFAKIAWFDDVLALVAYLVAIVATACILASISNSMHERRREFAILRAIGAHRGTVCGAIVAEAATMAGLGMIGAFGVYALMGGGAAQLVQARTGVVLQVFGYHPVMWIAPLAIVALAALAGVVPALQAYRTDVAAGLAPQT